MEQKKERVLALALLLAVSLVALLAIQLQWNGTATIIQGFGIVSGGGGGPELPPNPPPGIGGDDGGAPPPLPSGENGYSPPNSGGNEGSGYYCGNRTCDSQSETSATCPADCEAVCGDKACTRTENLENCPVDCQAGCGNMVCESNETPSDCEIDCGEPNEVVIFNQTIDFREIVPESPLQIKDRLNALGLNQIPIEILDAGTKNFSLKMEFNERKIRVGSYQSANSLTAVSIMIKNNRQQDYTDVELLVAVPKEAAFNASEIQSSNQYTVIQQDPALQFVLYKLPSEGEKLVSYSVPNKVLTKEETQRFPNPIVVNFRPIRPEDLPKVGCHSDSECAVPICHESRCIDQECYKLRQPPGTSCGAGMECAPSLSCQEKVATPYNKPISLLELPSLMLIVVIFVLAIWIIKEYATEN